MSITHVEPIAPGFVAADRELPDAGPMLHVARRDDGTLMVRVTGRRGGVKAWLELSAEDAQGLRDYLSGQS